MTMSSFFCCYALWNSRACFLFFPLSINPKQKKRQRRRQRYVKHRLVGDWGSCEGKGKSIAGNGSIQITQKKKTAGRLETGPSSAGKTGGHSQKTQAALKPPAEHPKRKKKRVIGCVRTGGLQQASATQRVILFFRVSFRVPIHGPGWRFKRSVVVVRRYHLHHLSSFSIKDLIVFNRMAT